MDIVVTYAGEQHIIELKIWHGEQYNADGEKQLSDCLDYQHLKKGIFKGVLKDIPKNAYFQKNHARLGYRKDKRKIIQFLFLCIKIYISSKKV